MNFYIKYLGVGGGGSRISIEIQNLLTQIDYVDEDCLSSLFKNHPSVEAAHPRRGECFRVKQTVLESNKVKDLRALIEQSGFMNLDSIYGESQGGRAYDYVIEAKLEDIEKTVTYLSSPAASPAPEAFAEVQARILEIFNRVVQEPVVVPISPQQTVTDITLFEHPSDPTTKFYLPRYAIAEQNVSGKQQFQISLQQSGLGGTLTVHLKQYPASEIEISSRDANIINHRVSVLLSHRSTVDGSSSERRQLTFQEVTTEPGGVRAVVKLSSLNEYNRLFQVMTNFQFDSILVVNRELTVAVPVFTPSSNPEAEGRQLNEEIIHYEQAITQIWETLESVSDYDPSPYRPGTPGWTGQVGRIAFINTTSETVEVRLYHADAPKRIFGTYTVDPGVNLWLADSANIGMDWGIQVNSSDIAIVGHVSDWGEFQGTYNFQTWPKRLNFRGPTSYDPSPYRPGTPGWTGQVGRIGFINTTSETVEVRLYHADAPKRIFGTYTVDPGVNLWLADSANIGMDWGIQVNSSDIAIVGHVSDWGEFQGTYNFQTWPARIDPTGSSLTENHLDSPTGRRIVELIQQLKDQQQALNSIRQRLEEIQKPLYEETSYILDDRSDRLNPFVFSQALHPYIYEDVNLLDGLIQRTVTWSSSSWSYYQDAAQRHVFKYLPHVFKLARSTEPPYYPALSVQFVWNGTSSIPDQVEITYRAAPFTDPNRRVAEAQQLQQLIDRVPVFEPLVAKSRLQISNTWTSSGQPHIKDPIDLRRDFQDALTLTLEGFRELFNSLFTQTSALKGEVVVDINENQQEIIPLIGRVNDLAPLDDGNVAPPAVPDPETLLKFLLAAQVPPKIEREITVATFAPLFEPSNDHPGNPIIAIMVDFFGQGDTVSLTPDKLTNTVTLYLPLVDYVLNESIQGTYRYQVTIIYKNGESIKRSEQQSDDTKLYILKSEGV